MHLRSFLLIIASAALVTLTSCSRSKSNKPSKVTNEITASVVTAIEAHDGITVRYSQGKGDAAIKVTCPQQYAQELNVRVEGTKLIAAFKPGAAIPTSGVDVTLTAPTIDDISAADGAIVIIGNETTLLAPLSISVQHGACVKSKKLTASNLTLNAEAASQIQFDRLTANDINARATQSATIYLEGHAHDVKLSIGSRSTIRYDKLNHNSLTQISIDETPAKPEPKKKVEAPKPETPKADADTTQKAADATKKTADTTKKTE